MTSIFDIQFSNKSNFNLSFLVDTGKSQWYKGEEKQNDDFLNKDFKTEIPKGKIFEINSLIFDMLKQQKEILTKYECYYDDQSNSLSVIFSEEINFEDFTKEIMLNMFEFAEKVGIERIYFLVAKKNPQYIRIVHDLMIIGFEVNEKLKTVNIEGNAYKVLSLPVKEDFDEIEEVVF